MTTATANETGNGERSFLDDIPDVCAGAGQAVERLRAQNGWLAGQDLIRVELVVPAISGSDLSADPVVIYCRDLVGGHGLIERTVRRADALCDKLSRAGVAGGDPDGNASGDADTDEALEPESDDEADDEDTYRNVGYGLQAIAVCVSINGQAGTGVPGGATAIDLMLPARALPRFHREIAEQAVSLGERLAHEYRHRVLAESDNGNGR
ncbi:MAG: hypothetical protein ABIG44_04590 [Planctomycetota bacterium]